MIQGPCRNTKSALDMAVPEPNSRPPKSCFLGWSDGPVRRQLLFPVDDNYFSRSTTTIFSGRAIARRCFLSWFRKRGIRGGGKVENLLFGFPLLQPPSSSELWERGSLASPCRDSQAAPGKSGEP